MQNKQKVNNSSRDRRTARRMLAVVMAVFLLLLSGCGARSRGTDASAAQLSGTSLSAVGLRSFSELSEIPDGSYWIQVSMTGGSGRASISSPTGFYVKDGQPTADNQWSSARYDNMNHDGVPYNA